MPNRTGPAVPARLVATLLAASAVLYAMPATAQDEAAVVAAEREDEGRRSGFEGSAVSYRTSAATLGFDRSADLTYNPYVEMSFAAAPRYQVVDWFAVSAYLAVGRELTDADWTTRQGEWMWSDLTLRPSFPAFATIPGADIDVSADIGLTFPTSRASQARTRIMAAAPGVSLARSFDVLSGLSLGASLRATGYLHRSTTGEYETPLIADCGVACDELQNDGVRNRRWSLQSGVSLSLAPVDMLRLSVSAGWLQDHLHDAVEDERVTFAPDDPDNIRYLSTYGVAATVSPLDWLDVTLGTDTTFRQLRPSADGYYAPFFNRFTQLYLDVSFDVGTFVSSL